jgi:hypothetical protein
MNYNNKNLVEENKVDGGSVHQQQIQSADIHKNLIIQEGDANGASLMGQSNNFEMGKNQLQKSKQGGVPGGDNNKAVSRVKNDLRKLI